MSIYNVVHYIARDKVLRITSNDRSAIVTLEDVSVMDVVGGKREW